MNKPCYQCLKFKNGFCTNTVKTNMFEGKTYFTAKKYRSKCNGDYFVSKLPILSIKREEINSKINKYTSTFNICFASMPLVFTSSIFVLFTDHNISSLLYLFMGFPYAFFTSFLMYKIDSEIDKLEKEKNYITNEINKLE